MAAILRRREALIIGAAASLATLARPAAAADWACDQTPRRAALKNLHTGDAFDEVYYADGRYIPGALAEAQRVLRDWRTGDEHFMDPRLFDTLHAIQTRLETRQPFQIISGYRSPKTNAMLHARSDGVASNSQHMQGKAVDVRLEGVDLRNLRRAALDVSAGGVGYYPVSNFVHVDVARVRQWVGV